MIVICEPQCWGSEHATVNAALIGTVADAFEEEEFLFLAEAEHIKFVQKILEAHSVSVRYCERTIPPRNLPNLQRSPSEFRLCNHVFRVAHQHHANTIIFCSVTSPGLISIKALLRRYTNVVCVVVPHDILQDVATVPRLLPQPLFFWFRLWISLGNVDRLRYVVLSPLIKERLKRYVPTVSDHVSSIDLPYFFSDAVNHRPFTDNGIHFGSFGDGSFGKGTDTFFRLAEEVQSTQTTCRPTFTLIGHLLDKRLKDVPHASVFVPSADIPLNKEAYERYGTCIDYALFFHVASAYELVASGAMLDAFSFLKPIIALKSPMSEYYFEKMGDIGYLCDTRDDMKSIILEILEKTPVRRYRAQQKTN